MNYLIQMEEIIIHYFRFNKFGKVKILNIVVEVQEFLIVQFDNFNFILNLIKRKDL